MPPRSPLPLTCVSSYKFLVMHILSRLCKLAFVLAVFIALTCPAAGRFGKTSGILCGAPPDLHDQVEKSLDSLLQ